MVRTNIDLFALYNHLPSFPVWSSILTDNCISISRSWSAPCGLVIALNGWSSYSTWLLWNGPRGYWFTRCPKLLLLLLLMLCKHVLKWWLHEMRLLNYWSLRMIGSNPLMPGISGDSGKLSCKLLIYSLKLSKSLLQLWRELAVWPSSMKMYLLCLTRIGWRLRLNHITLTG